MKNWGGDCLKSQIFLSENRKSASGLVYLYMGMEYFSLARTFRTVWGGGAKLICMSKVRDFSEIAPNIAFPELNFYELYYSSFEKSELGRIKKLLPLREMAENFGQVRKSMRSKLGPQVVLHA